MINRNRLPHDNLETKFEIYTLQMAVLPNGLICRFTFARDINCMQYQLYEYLRDASRKPFPWKGILSNKMPKKVAFFVWTAALDKFFTSSHHQECSGSI
jgi:hypothetical protein